MLAAYQKARLERDERIKNLKASHARELEELKTLRSEAAAAAKRIKSSATAPQISAPLNKTAVDKEIAKVGSSLNTYGGFFEKLQRKAVGRTATAWLRAADPVLTEQISSLEVAGPEEWDRLAAEQSAADREMLNTLERHRGELDAYAERIGAAALPLDNPAWAENEGNDSGPSKIVKVAEGFHWIAGEKQHLPLLAKVPGENIHVAAEWFPERRKDFVNSLLLRSLRASAAGQLKMLLIDPTSLGEVFSPLLSVSAHSEDVIHTKVWTSESDIRARLEEASDRAGLIIQKYLTDEHETLEEYNEAAGEVTEASVVIAINDFPRGLDARSIEIVKSLAEVGPRCGISLVVLSANELDQEQTQACKSVIDHTPVMLGWWELQSWFSSSGTYGAGLPQTVAQLNEKVKGVWLDLYDIGPNGLTARASTMTYVSVPGRPWHVEPPAAWDPDVAEPVLEAVGKQFDSGSKVEVQMDRVWELYANARDDGALNDFAMSDPATWWKLDSVEGIEVPIGRHGSHGVSTVRFDSQLSSGALLVGRPGSGKSNLLHVMICTLAALYPPDELELYLLDFKEAVEFAGYAGTELPHARAIALESDRDFGLAVLRHVSAEIERRGQLFRGSVGEQANLIAYRRQSGERVPRILLLIDEFHRLFDREDAIAAEAAKHLDDIIRLGRGFGIHCLLASQTLLGMSSLGRHSLNQIATRLALPCSEEDSRVLFNDDNPAASLLTRPGEGIKNASSGHLTSNEPFQVPLVDDQNRADLLAELRARADAEEFSGAPRIYRRDVLASWAPAEPAGLPAVRLGEAVAMDPAFGYDLARESGRNILIVGRNELMAGSMLAATMADLRASHGDDVELTVVDLMAVDGPVERTATQLGVAVRRRRDFADVVALLGEIADGREPSRALGDTTHVLVLNGLGKVRELDVDDFSDEAQALGDRLHALLRDGPEVGVHTIAWCDSVAGVDRRIGRRMEREFGAHVAFTMSPEDSIRFCDSDAAASLQAREALLVDLDHGVSTKFQPSDSPELELLGEEATSDV
jgi:hypothetical protein